MLSERHMKKKSKEQESDDLQAEYDLGELLPIGVQGKYADRFRQGTKVAMLEPDVAEALPTDEAMNASLRRVIHLQMLPKSPNEGVPEGSNHGA